MKFTFKGTIAVIVGVIFIYTACKKVDNAPAAPKVASEQQVAGVIASDISASLAGTYGGVTLKDGVKAPKTLSINNNGPVVNSLNPLCGFTVDTTVSYHSNVNGVKSFVKGKFMFTYTCSANSAFPDGYVVTTDLVSAGSAATYSFVYAIAQHYTVQSLDPQDTLVSLDGTLKSFGDFKFKNGHHGLDTNYKPNPIFQHQSYVLTGLQIDIPAGLDIITGTATFTTTGNNAFGIWTYHGTITFIGGHKAIITLNGQVCLSA